jgi:ferric-dicitrate binding protein FerR (iron transport regulator)
MTPIAEVAAELNRYNYTHILVEDLPAGALQLTGVFDVDRPLTLVSYAQKQPTLTVEHRGNDWVIRSHDGR